MIARDGMGGRGERVAVPIGLLAAVSAGAAGAAVESVTIQTVLYAASSIGWVVATAILTGRHVARGEFIVAGGFLVLTMAETLLWVSGRPGDPGYEAGFAGGVMFYVPGLLLVGIPAVYPNLVRMFAALGAAAWAVGSGFHLTGSGFSPSDPLAFAGYTLLSAAFVGIGVVTLRGGGQLVGRGNPLVSGAGSNG